MSGPLLSQFVRTLARPVGKSERKRARLHLLDWLACIAGARGSEAHALASAVSTRGWERATYCGNVLDVEDVHRTSALHPGPVVWPAAMSMPSADLDIRLDAAVRGYEAMIAIGSALDEHHRTHWDPTATTGVFGACAAFGSLIGFAPIEYANALGNAGSVTGGLRHFEHDPGVLTGQWHIYHAVRTGRDAALQCHYGATGPQAILEGAQGIFQAMTREPGALASNGDGWLIEQIVFRTFAAGEQFDAAIAIAMEQRDGGDLDIPQQRALLHDAVSLADHHDSSIERALITKMHSLAKWGGLPEAEAHKAVSLSLHEHDADALDRLVEEWTR